MNGFDLSTISDLYVGSTQYSAIYKGSNLIWSAGPVPYDKQYLTIEFEYAAGSALLWETSNSSFTRTIQYSTDGKTWYNLTSKTENDAQNNDWLRDNKVYYFRGTNTEYGNGSYYCRFHISGYENCIIYGNLGSLIDYTGFKNGVTLSSHYAFRSMFNGNPKITDASNLVLPANLNGKQYAYYQLFKTCINLVTPPTSWDGTFASVATFREAFQNCSGMTTCMDTPNITNAQSYAFFETYRGCSALTTFPSKFANTVATQAYKNMFVYCSSLTGSPTIQTTSFTGSNQFDSMFYQCTNITGCTINAASNNYTGCMNDMFYGCSKLNAVYLPNATSWVWSASSPTNRWLNSVASSGTLYVNSNQDTSNIPSGNSGLPSGWTIQTLS